MAAGANQDLGEIIRRLDAVETAVKDQGAQITAQGAQITAQSNQFTEITVKIALLDRSVNLLEKGMEGVRGEIVGLRQEHADGMDKMSKAITSTGLELNSSIDLVIQALRIDKKAGSVKEIGDSIDFAGRLKRSYEKRREWAERAGIGGIMAVVGAMLFEGYKRLIAQ